jgi:hypothetical protein
MSELWHTRGQWDRIAVMGALRGVFDDVMEDMNACQQLMLEGSHFLDD